MNAIIEQFLIETLNENLIDLFKSLEKKYGKTCGFTNEELFARYKIKGISKIRGYQRKYKVVSPLELDLENRCNARVWGGNVPRVVFNELTDRWEYGNQCSRNKRPGEKYCGIHLKKLPHGDIMFEPPHRHFEAHKKIDLKICHG